MLIQKDEDMDEIEEEACLANPTLSRQTVLPDADAEEGVVLRQLLVRPLRHHNRQVERHLVPHDVHLLVRGARGQQDLLLLAKDGRTRGCRCRRQKGDGTALQVMLSLLQSHQDGRARAGQCRHVHLGGRCRRWNCAHRG